MSRYRTPQQKRYGELPQFDELNTAFQSRFGRSLYVTGGADTPMHRRLHGGAARDVRSRDLTPDEQTFLSSEAPRYGLRERIATGKERWATGPHRHYDAKLKGASGGLDFDDVMGGADSVLSKVGLSEQKQPAIKSTATRINPPSPVTSGVDVDSGVDDVLKKYGIGGGGPAVPAAGGVVRPEFTDAELDNPPVEKIGQYQNFLLDKTKDYPGAGGPASPSNVPEPLDLGAVDKNKIPAPTPSSRGNMFEYGDDREQQFQSWYAGHAKRLKLDPNPDDPRHHYNYRAAFEAGAGPDPKTGHWPSHFKLPGHPNRFVDGIDTITGQPLGDDTPIRLSTTINAGPIKTRKRMASEAATTPNAKDLRGIYVSDLLQQMKASGVISPSSAADTLSERLEGAIASQLNIEPERYKELLAKYGSPTGRYFASLDPDEVYSGLKEAGRFGDKMYFALPPETVAEIKQMELLDTYERMSDADKKRTASEIATRRDLTPDERKALGLEHENEISVPLGLPGVPLTASRVASGVAGLGRWAGETEAGVGRIVGSESLVKSGEQTQRQADVLRRTAGDPGIGGDVYNYAGQMAPEVLVSLALPEGRAIQIPYWMAEIYTRNRGLGLSHEEALKEAGLGVAVGEGMSLLPKAAMPRGAAPEVYPRRIKLSADEFAARYEQPAAMPIEGPAPVKPRLSAEEFKERFPQQEASTIVPPSPPHHSVLQPRDKVGRFNGPPEQAASTTDRVKVSPDQVSETAPARMPETINPKDYVNLDRLNVSDAEKQNLGRLVQESVAAAPEPKARVTFDDIKREAAEIDPELLNHLEAPKPGETLHPAVRLAARERLNSVNSEIVNLQRQIEAGRSTLPVDELQKLEARAAVLERDGKGLLDVLIPTRSQDGRNLAYHRIMAETTGFDSEYWIAKARRTAERSGTDIESKGYQKSENEIRKVLVEGRQAEVKVSEIQSRIAELRNDPAVIEFERALKEAKAAGVKPPNAQRQARRAAAESYKAKLADVEMAARERLKEFFNPNVVHDATDIGRAVADLAVVGAAKLARKGIDKAVWASEMIQEFGESVRPHIAAIYQRSYTMYRGEREGAITAARKLRLAGGDLSSVTTEELDSLMKQADLARNQARRARLDLALTYRRLEKTHIADIGSAYRVTGMLSSARMLGQDIISTGLFQPMEALASVPGAIHDLVIGAATRQRGLVAETPASFTKAHVKGGVQGLREAPQILKHGATDAQLERLELPSEVNSGSRIVDFLPNAITRVRSAADNVPFTQAYHRELHNRAKAIALTEAKQGKIPRNQVDARTAEIVKNPPAVDAAESLFDTGLVEAAQQDARVSTFNQQNWISDTFQRGKQKGPWPRFFVNMPFPFTRAVPNIIWKGVEYSPAGYGVYAGQALKALVAREFPLEAQRQMSKTFGRATVGTGLTLLGYTFAKQGYVIGTSERSQSERALDRAAGRQPLAVYNPLNGTWHDLQWLGPAAYPVGLGANIAESDSLGDFARASYNLYLKQHPVNRGGEMLPNPTRISEEGLKKQAGRMASSFVPAGGLLRDVAIATDDKARVAEGFTAQVQSNIPGWRNALPEMTDAMGRPAQHSRLWSIDPSRSMTAKDKTDPVLSELVRLKVGLPRPEQKPAESKEDFKARATRQGQYLEQQLTRVIASPIYQKPPEGVDARAYQRKAVELTEGAARDAASSGRAPHAGDDAIILFNARVSIEADRIIEQAKHKEYYRRLDSIGRGVFERAVRDAFDGAKASLNSEGDPGSKLVRASGAFSEKMSDQASIIQRAVEKARGVK